MATIYYRDGIWWINYAANGQSSRISTDTGNKRLAEVKLQDLKVKLFKGKIGAKRVTGANCQ